MKKKFLGILLGLMITLIGIILILVSWLYSEHQQLLNKADALAAEGKFVEALQAYQEAETHYLKTFLGIPQGPILDVLSPFGVETRSYIKLRLAEMEFREGERLLTSYGQTQLISTNASIINPPDGNQREKPSLEEIIKHFEMAEEQYKQIQDQTQDAYWRFIANANGARTMVQNFLIKAFLEEQPRDPLSLKQSLVRAIKSIQSALNALYTDQVRISSLEERGLVLLLETLTRFQRTPEEESTELEKMKRFFEQLPAEATVAPFGEILRTGGVLSLTQEEQNLMREFLLNQSPGAASREEDELQPGTQGIQAGAGSQGKIH